VLQGRLERDGSSILDMSEGSGQAVGLDFFAGCVAGTLSILACHPLDTIRIRLQSGQFSSISECFKSSRRNEGALGLYKGLIPPLVGVSLINASLFGMKAVTQGFLKDIDDESVFNADQPNFKHLMISSATAGLASGFISSPVELLKIRQQLDQRGSDSAKLWPLTRDIVRNSGFLSLFRGLSATLVREVPSFPAYFVTYEYSKIYLQGVLPEDSAFSDMAAILTAGSLAGIAGWVFVYPIDVIKTKIQAEPSLIWKDRVSCVQMYRRLLKESGRSVFMRGFGATILRAVPTNAVIFGGYELTLEICSRIAGFDRTKIE
jgi:solute carrier family 25 carnitine/acylcarnitine transporter 20/29